MKINTIFLVLATTSIMGCAQVPSSSVTVSASITKDIQSMQKSHRQFINFYYDGLEEQVNNLIDKKYRPSLIRNVLNQDLANLKKMETQHKSLLNAVQLAFFNPNNFSNEELEKVQANAMSGLQIFYTKIDVQVERKRQPLLLKLKNQRQQLLSESSQSYNNIIKKNNVITNLLSSVSDVHDSQKELLELIGMDTDTREQIGGKLSTLSEKVIEINSSVSEKTSKVDDIEKAIDKLTKLFEK